MARRPGGEQDRLQDQDIRVIPDDPGAWDFVDAAHVTRYEWAAGSLGEEVIGSVVDAGCGTGYGVACLARLFPSKRFVGADYSEAGVALARRTHASLPNARFVVLDLTAAETLEVARFDAALSFDVIEHIADYDRYVDGLDRVLRPGGLLICATPNRATRWDYSDVENPYHAHEFTADELAVTLGRRFVVERVLGQHIVNERKRRYHIEQHSRATLPLRDAARRTLARRLRRRIDRRLLRLHRFKSSDIGFLPEVGSAFGLVVVARKRDDS